MRTPKSPKFTDTHRFTGDYTPSHSTDISQTFKRVAAQHKKTAEETKNKVSTLPRRFDRKPTGGGY